MTTKIFLLIPILGSFLPGINAAFCGTSTIPYSFEALPDGSYSLGCARPACFGYEPTSGNWASQDSSFNQIGGHPDGYLRTTDQIQRAPFLATNPQTAACFGAPSCVPGQWAGGYDGNSLICCGYPLLNQAQDLGTAAIRPGDIAIGGEQQPGSFDYIRNIQAVRTPGGQIDRYDVEMGRMSCPEPMAVQAAVEAVAPQQVIQQQAVAPSYYQPAYYGGGGGGFGDFRCFTGDSMVTLMDGSTKRMDELAIGDWVKSPTPSLFEVMDMPVESWLHRLPEKETEFIVLKTEGGKQLKMTEDHYLYRTPCNVTGFKRPEMVRARDIAEGDCLLELNTQTHAFFTTTEVTEIGATIEKGIYAPLTDGGQIIINGLMVSCFSDTKNDVLVQTVRENLVNCDDAEGLESLQCNLKENGISLLLEMVKFSLPEGMSF